MFISYFIFCKAIYINIYIYIYQILYKHNVKQLFPFLSLLFSSLMLKENIIIFFMGKKEQNILTQKKGQAPQYTETPRTKEKKKGEERPASQRK